MKTKQVYGGIDIVMNNAGIGDEVNWKKTIAVNLVSHHPSDLGVGFYFV